MTSIRFLSSSEIEAIHASSMETLEKTGIMVSNPNALEILERFGCSVESQMVRISENIVKEALDRAPSCFQLHNQDDKNAISIGWDNVIFNPGSSAIFFIDRVSDKMRKANSNDLLELVSLVDNLEYIQAQSTAVIPSDLPSKIADLYRLYIVLKASAKPVITGAFTKEGLTDMKNMLAAVSGGPEELRESPRAIFDCCPSSPLIWGDVSCQNLIDCAKYEIPAEIVPAPQMGATSPITLAGTLVQSNAETLAGVVISQLTKPGAPLIYGIAPAAFDMRYGTSRPAAIESMMVACAASDLGKYYGLPTNAYLGVSESKTIDSQTGFESALGIALAALARVNVVSGPGMLAFENCQSLEKLVIDNELCGMATRLIKGIDVLESTLPTDLIHKVGPGGHFLADTHTREHFLSEHTLPTDIICRLTPDSWKTQGSKSVRDRAREIVGRLLDEPRPKPLDNDVEERLNEAYKHILAKYAIEESEIPHAF